MAPGGSVIGGSRAGGGPPPDPAPPDPGLRVLGEVRFPENLPLATANDLGDAFRTFFLEPNRTALGPAGYTPWREPATGRSVYSCGVPPPEAPAEGVGALGSGYRIRFALGPDGVTIEFEGNAVAPPAIRARAVTIADEARAFIVLFLARARFSTIYLALSPPPDRPVPDDPDRAANRSAPHRILTGNVTTVAFLVVLLTIPVVLWLGYLGLIVVVAAQGLVLFYSDRLILRSGAVRLSAGSPRCTVVSLSLARNAGPSPKVGRGPVVRAVREALGRLPAGAYSDPAALKSAAVDAARRAGVPCSPDDVAVVTRDLYGLLERLARRFVLPVPRAVVVDTAVANAAASGISPGRAVISITAGALEELDDDQLEATLGHEFGHIRGRHPVVLFAATAVLYLGVPFLWPSVFVVLGFGYFVVVLIALFALGKLLETRADDASARVVQKPRALAAALTEIAFTEFLAEKRSVLRRWLNWLDPDAHPPVYFRIQRLLRRSSALPAAPPPAPGTALPFDR